VSKQTDEKILEYLKESLEYFQDKSMLFGLSPHERFLFKLGTEALQEITIDAQLQQAGLFTGVLSKPTEEN
jgi:hypothetical protein